MFAHLPLSDAQRASVNDSLTQVGFRRSQNIAYRPACEACTACISARPAGRRIRLLARSERKALARNEDLERATSAQAEATMEQFEPAPPPPLPRRRRRRGRK